MWHMWRKLCRAVVPLGLAVALAVPLFGASMTRAQTASAAPLGAANCYALKVHLHGNDPATVTCVVTREQAAVAPDTVDKGCGDSNLLQLYENDNYGGARICFFGTGFANLADYWIWVLARNWDEEMTSFKTGRMTGRFFWYSNGGAPTYNYSQGQSNPNIGSTWNDEVSSISIDSCNGYC